MRTNSKVGRLMRGVGIGAFCSFGVVGCSSESDSVDVDTSDIRANYSLTATSSGVDVVASFRASLIGSDPVLRLTDGDRVVVVSPGNVRAVLSQSGNEYRVSLNNPAVAGEYRIELDRSNDRDANNSLVTFPNPLIITEPISGTIADTQTQQSLPVRWSTATVSTTTVDINFSFACANNTSYSDTVSVSDNGQYNYNVTAFLAGQNTATNNCQLTTEVERDINGTIDTRLDNRSSITATQKISSTISLQ